MQLPWQQETQTGAEREEENEEEERRMGRLDLRSETETGQGEHGECGTESCSKQRSHLGLTSTVSSLSSSLVPPPPSHICLIKSSCSSTKSPSNCDAPVPNLGQKTASAAAARSRESAAHVSAPQERTVQIKRGRINYS